MTDKGFTLFDQCLHMSSQEEECICSSWEDSKMYTPGSIASSQRMLTEINESGATAKIRIWDGKWYCQTFKAFRIISSKIKISLLILSWWNSSCLHIQICFLLSYELKMFFQVFVPKVYRSVVLKNKSWWTVIIIFINKLRICQSICFNISTQSKEWE